MYNKKVVTKISEKDIQTAVCDYLQLKGLFFWRQNVIPVFNKKKEAFMRMPKYSKNGVPDIILVKQGKFIGLEIKLPKGKQSENQIKFQNELQQAGGEYYLITSIDDLIKIL